MRVGVLSLLCAGLVGCGGEAPRVKRLPASSDEVVVEQAPRAVGDPLWVSAQGEVRGTDGPEDYLLPLAEPVVETEDGEPVPVVPVTWQDEIVGYEPVGGWQPGWYAVTGSEGYDPVPEAQAFTVGPWGSGAVDPQTLVGTTWEVTSAWTAPLNVADIALDAGRLFLEIQEADDEGVVFALLGDGGPGPCILLADRGTWAGSSLHWARDALTIDADPPIEAWDLALSAHFDAATPDEASAQLRGIVDADALDAALLPGQEPGEICSIASGIGVDCLPCGTDQRCTGAAAYALALERVDPFEGPHPVCGIVPLQSPDDPPLTCQTDWDPVDCSCDNTRVQQGAIPVWMLLLTVLARRRR